MSYLAPCYIHASLGRVGVGWVGGGGGRSVGRVYRNTDQST